MCGTEGFFVQFSFSLSILRLHPPPGRTDKHLCRCFGAPATHARRPHGRVFPDHPDHHLSILYLWCIVSVQALDEVLPLHAIVPHYAVVDAGEADTPPHNPDL